MLPGLPANDVADGGIGHAIVFSERATQRRTRGLLPETTDGLYVGFGQAGVVTTGTTDIAHGAGLESKPDPTLTRAIMPRLGPALSQEGANDIASPTIHMLLE